MEVLADADVLILPVTADTVVDALADGGSVTILRRWSKAKIKKMQAAKEITEEAADILLEEMKGEKAATYTDKSKQVADAAGIKTSGNSKHALVYETWVEMEIDDERRLCRVYYGGADRLAGCKRNPYWSDRCPLFSVPVENVQGSFKGVSKVKPTAQTQYYANDIINQAADSSMYSMLPIVMTDPEKNPRIGSMVLSLAAVWETSPNDTQFAKFPDIWKSGFEIVGQCKSQIMQTLSVSPAAITQSGTQKSKPSQADTAREQQVDILTTADAVTVIEEGVLTPVVNFIIELDHQYRDYEILVREFGEKGLRAKMEWIPPIQMEKKYSYRWFGVEQARNQMQVQAQIAGMGVIKSIPPDQYKGYRLNLVPLITHLCENLFGPRLAPLIFEDEAAQMTIDAALENQMLADGFNIPIHPQDDDPKHIQTHQEALQAGDPTRSIELHIRKHMVQMQLKQQAQMAQQVQQMMQGGQQPGGQGGQRGPGPRPGAQPRMPRPQGPAGMIPRDQIGPAAGQPPALRQRG